MKTSVVSAPTRTKSTAAEPASRRTQPPISPETLETASLKIPLRAGPAKPQISRTSPAVMRVTRTQPGTSPRSGSSSGKNRAAKRCAPWCNKVVIMRSSRAPAGWPGSSQPHLQQGESGEDGEHDGHREDEEHHRDHHGHLLAPARLHERAAPRLAHVLSLGAQHLGERRTAFHRDG